LARGCEKGRQAVGFDARLRETTEKLRETMQSCQLWRKEAASPAAPSEGDLARSTLLFLARDPEMRSILTFLLDGSEPEQLTRSSPHKPSGSKAIPVTSRATTLYMHAPAAMSTRARTGTRTARPMFACSTRGGRI
jgi:hypothetical protein